MKRIAVLIAAFVLLGAGRSEASLIWDWSFAGESGQFVTDGVAHVPGTYTLADFSVTSTSSGASVGSVSGGQYAASGFSTLPPYQMTWNGALVTFWDSAGTNTFDWWVFNEVAQPNRYYFFGWATGNVNDPNSAAYYDSTRGIFDPVSVGRISVSPAVAAPEPALLALLGLGAAGMRIRKRRQ